MPRSEGCTPSSRERKRVSRPIASAMIWSSVAPGKLPVDASPPDMTMSPPLKKPLGPEPCGTVLGVRMRVPVTTLILSRSDIRGMS